MFPHSEISGSMLIYSSPKLIAVRHVLLRLLMPRHSPYALSSLNLLFSGSHDSCMEIRNLLSFGCLSCEKTSYHLSDFVFVTHYLILERPIFYNCFSLICSFAFIRFSMNIFSIPKECLVGTSGLEPPTSRLSGARSNQLSYAPILVYW